MTVIYDKMLGGSIKPPSKFGNWARNEDIGYNFNSPPNLSGRSGETSQGSLGRMYDSQYGNNWVPGRMYDSKYGNAQGGTPGVNLAQPVYRGNDAGQAIGTPNVSGMTLDEMRQSNYGARWEEEDATRNTGVTPMGGGNLRADGPELLTKPSEALNLLRTSQGSDSMQMQGGGFDLTDPNFDPMANMELPQSGNVAELAAASQAQESALAQLEDIPGDTPPTGLLGYEQAIGQGFDAGMEGYQGGKQEAIQMMLNAYRGSVDPVTGERVMGSKDFDIQETNRAAQMMLNAYRGSVNPVTGERVMGSRDFDIQETNRAADAMRGYSQGGAEAQQLQAALTGALGREAQAQAIANFQESPGQKYLREQTERGVLRNAAAVGGLSGGNVLKALQANAAGLASQDFQNQFNRLSNVADRGMTASGTMADLFSNLGSRQAQMRNQMGANIADLYSNLGSRQASMRNQMGANLAGVAERYGQRAGDLGFQTGNILGANRQRVGQSIADNIAATSGAIAGQQSGDLLASIMSGDSGNLVNLINAAQSGDAASNEALAALLSNLSVGAGSNISGLPGLPGIKNTAAEGLKAFGSFLSGTGTAMGGGG